MVEKKEKKKKGASFQTVSALHRVLCNIYVTCLLAVTSYNTRARITQQKNLPHLWWHNRRTWTNWWPTWGLLTLTLSAASSPMRARFLGPWRTRWWCTSYAVTVCWKASAGRAFPTGFCMGYQTEVCMWKLNVDETCCGLSGQRWHIGYPVYNMTHVNLVLWLFKIPHIESNYHPWGTGGY